MRAFHSGDPASMIARRLSSLALVLGLLACSVDDRTLGAPPGPTEIGASGAPGEEGGAGGAEGGAAGERPSGEGLVDGCADLDTDGVADCEATLLENGTFQSDVDGWTVLGEAELGWEPENALGDLPSGSAKLSAQLPRASAYQCVPLDGKHLVIAYASAWVEPSDDSEDPPQAELEVTFFQGEGCSGVSDGYFETPPSADSSAWTTIQAGGQSMETTQSVSVALVGVKPSSASELNIYFDNVMLKAQAP